MKYLVLSVLIALSGKNSLAATENLELIDAQFKANLAIMEAYATGLEGINQSLSRLHRSLWLENQEMAISNIKRRLSTGLKETDLHIESIRKTKGLGEENVLRYIRLANNSLDELQTYVTSEQSGYFEIQDHSLDFERFMKKAAKEIEDYSLLAQEKPEKFPLSEHMKGIIDFYNETILRGKEVYHELETVDKEPRFWLPKDGKTIAENYIVIQPQERSAFQGVLKVTKESLIASELKYRTRVREKVNQLDPAINSSYKIDLFNEIIDTTDSRELEGIYILSNVTIENLWEKQAVEILLTDIKKKFRSPELINLADSVKTEENLRAFIEVVKPLI